MDSGTDEDAVRPLAGEALPGLRRGCDTALEDWGEHPYSQRSMALRIGWNRQGLGAPPPSEAASSAPWGGAASEGTARRLQEEEVGGGGGHEQGKQSSAWAPTRAGEARKGPATRSQPARGQDKRRPAKGHNRRAARAAAGMGMESTG
jgi:hypothetical protein